MISYQTEGIKMPDIKKKETTGWIKEVAACYGKRVGEIAYIFCSDDKILEVNRQYLQHDYYTDIITFDYCEGDRISGDLFISLDTVRSNAEQFEQPYDLEKLTGEKENLKGFHLIPYRTVGKSGVMPVFELEKMYIVQKKQWIYRPLVGICEEQISEQGMYQMIINPEILGGRKNGCKSSNAAAV